MEFSDERSRRHKAPANLMQARRADRVVGADVVSEDETESRWIEFSDHMFHSLFSNETSFRF